jgi:hypothetical protein
MSVASIMPSRPAALVALAGVVLAGCQVGPRPVHDGWAMPHGDWQVVSQVAPGIAAMSPVDAAGHVGQTIRYGPDSVSSGRHACAKPVYAVNLVYAERYLWRQYGLHTVDLGLYRHQDVKITEVFCEGRKWPALGGHVVWVDDERGYAIRDGVWFELRRALPPS